MREYIVIRYTNETALFNRLVALAVTSNKDADRAEERIGLVSTPVMEDVVTGDKFLCTYLSSEDADKLPNNDHNPAFTIVWRSSEYDTGDPENPVWFPWPEAEINTYDENGDVNGTRMQGVNGIRGGYEG